MKSKGIFCRVFAMLLLVAAAPVPGTAAAPNGTNSARASAVADTAPPQANLAPTLGPFVASLNEGFDNITTLGTNGWSLQNNSSPLGTTNWFQGNSVAGGGPFDAYDGAANGYIAANYNNTGSTGTISNWMISPVLDFGSGAALSFFTRKASPDSYADRLEVRLSTNGASTNVGTTDTGVGDFATVLVSVNPNLVLGVYPTGWTQFLASSLPHNGQGRIAFRYFVTGGGFTGTASDYIGIDRVVYSAGAAEYKVSGSVNGLAASGLVLKLNGANDLPISASGAFTFLPYVTDGGNYAVTVSVQPTNPTQTCSVSNGSGTISAANVTNVSVTCVTNTYTVGGNVAGLSGSGLTLQLNGANNLPISAAGGFVFPQAVASGGNYAVTVSVQPSNPTQTCAVSNGSGTVTNANVTNVSVTCVTNTYTVGGSVAGLSGSGLTLRLNGANNLPISAAGGFVFPQAVASGGNYAVTVSVQPSNPPQTCSVSNGSGTVTNANVTNVSVTCVTNTYTVGGNVAGLSGSGLTLQLNGANNLSISAAGGFVFPQAVASGGNYAVTVSVQPSNPTQTCSVGNGSGTISGANVTNVSVTCVTNTYTVGGNVAGLSGSGLTLQLNGANNLPISAAGGFVFPQAVASGGNYAVTVSVQPNNPTQTCAVSNGSGTVTNANVTSVSVTCVTTTYTVGGSVAGLSGSGLTLQLNGANNLPISATGGFVFPQAVASGGNYAVTVSVQPSNPTQTCAVSNGSGTVTNANVTSVSVTCVTNTYTVGGNVAGLSGSGLTLQLNGANNLPISAAGGFVFPQAVASGGNYAVTVSVQPSNPTQTCSVSNGSGTIGGANISNVMVSCATTTYTVGGNVAGLSGSGLTLQLNGANNLPISSNGAFTFPAALADGSSYSVTASVQPSGPAQTCLLTQGSGRLAGANVTSVAVSCATNQLPTTTTLGSTPNPSMVGQSVSLIAAVSGQNPTGTMSFFDGLNPVVGCASVPLVGRTATCVTSALTSGSHSTTASYSGDVNNVPSVSNIVTQAVSAVPSVVAVIPTLNPLLLLMLGVLVGLIALTALLRRAR